MKKTVLFSLSFFLATFSIAQNNFEDAIRMGDEALAYQDYYTALQKYRAAQAFDLTRQREVDKKILNVFQAINDLRSEAEYAKMQTERALMQVIRAEAETNRQLQVINEAKAEVEHQKELVELKTAEIIKAKNIADSALLLANRIIDALYFYNDRFALAFRKVDENTGIGRYGFIDKNGNVIIDFKYSDAEPFDNNTGLARVKREGKLYLLDTLGVEYLLAENVNQLKDVTEALDLSSQNLSTIPSVIFEYPKLKILLLFDNSISMFPEEIENLSNLLQLDVSENNIQEIPSSIQNLKTLKVLDLSRNELTAIPNGLGFVTTLENLNLAYNNLITLPNSFFQYKNSNQLRLVLSGNNLTEADIPEEISNNPYLDLEIADFSRLGISSKSEDTDSITINLPEGKKRSYQQWLDDIGLGDYLQAHTIENDKGNFGLYLSFPTESIDSVTAIWTELKHNFEQKYPIALEKQLFYKMTEIMNIDQSKGNVQIYDTYDLRREPLFFKGIYFEDGMVKIETSNSKSALREIDTPIKQLDIKEEFSSKYFPNEAKKSEVLNLLLQFSNDYFSPEGCDVKSSLQLLENRDVFRLTIKDICPKLVEDKNQLCEILRRYDLNCNIKNLQLFFTIIVKEVGNSFQLFVDANGIFSSPLGEGNLPERNFYLNRDFEEFLNKQSKAFINNFEISLLKSQLKERNFELLNTVSSSNIEGRVIFVKKGSTGDGSSWENSFGDLQQALIAAKPVDQIWVAKGIYLPTTNNDRHASFIIPKGLQLFGGFSGTESSINQRDLVNNLTILSGEIGDLGTMEDNSFSVVTTENVGGSTVLDGFIIQRGFSNGTGPLGDVNRVGAGWYNIGDNGNSNPKIRNCIFIYNRGRDGTALFNYAKDDGTANPFVTHCLFLNNKADLDGGAVFNYANRGQSSPNIVHCSFIQNTATYGAGIMNSAANDGEVKPIISQCLFSGNVSYLKGSSIFNHSSGNGNIKPTVQNCIFEENASNIKN
jgi:hypothetical protein